MFPWSGIQSQMEMPICLKLDRQAEDSALDRTLVTAGAKRLERSPKIKMTASNSTKVNANELGSLVRRLNGCGSGP